MTLNEIKELYSEIDYKIMQWAEQARLPDESRLTEIITFARHAGIKRIGIANCVNFTKEAEQLNEILLSEFEVYTCNCKHGKITKQEFLNQGKGLSCNPISQALELDKNKTELNIVLGLCVGHDMLFNKHSKALTVSLVLKDRKYKNCPQKVFVKE